MLINNQKSCVNIAGADLVAHLAKLLVLDWLEHNTLLSVVVFYVVLNQFISQSCLRVLVITPHVQFTGSKFCTPRLILSAPLNVSI
jgi:hypothetical protein